jgi:protein O-mannosyl-transferase
VVKSYDDCQRFFNPGKMACAFEFLQIGNHFNFTPVIYLTLFMKRKKGSTRTHAGNKKTAKAIKAINPETWKSYIALAAILLISFLIYLPVFHNGLLTWDDDTYIKNNPLIYSIDLKQIFSTYVLGNYHPFTILTLALEYHFFGLNATGYHAVNLLLHLLNVILVFYTVLLLSDKKVIVALVAALLFGIHPLHVESVAWAAELKDLLYTFFFLASYIFYLRYLNDFRKKNYAFALMLFLLSILSKAMAASLPAVLILTDYFKGRKINMKTLLEKAPFFLLAIIFGIVAVLAQKSEGTTNFIDFPFPQRILFACYGFITYLYKLLLPIELSPFYPYPVRSGETIPPQFYAYLILVIGLIALVLYSVRYTKKIFFGVGFFSLTVFLVLQLFPVGRAIMADRYSYIPSIGIFYLAGEGFNLLWSKKSKLALIIALAATVTILFSVKTIDRCRVWKNDLTLWSDVISQYPNSSFAYNGRGYFHFNQANYSEAINDFNRSIELDPDDAHAYNLRGMVYMNNNRNDEAIDDFNKAIDLAPGNADAYVNRGWVFMNEGRKDEAINDYNTAIEIDPDYEVAYNNRGIYFINEKRNEQAIQDFDKAIELNPSYAEAYYDRANASMLLKRYEEAVSYYTRAIAFRDKYAEAYYYRGIAEYYSGKKNAACKDLKESAGLGYQPAADALAKMCK